MNDEEKTFELSEKYIDFCNTTENVDVDILEGTTASGKTTIAAGIKFMRMISESNKKEHIIAARTTGVAEKNIINQDNGILDIHKNAIYCGNGDKDHKFPHIKFENKIIYILSYKNKDQWENALGGQYGCVYIDEGNIADIDFIRILHCHYRFVGEMIFFAENDVTRNEIYHEATKYGLNNEKARWIAGFLVEAGLLEEPQYLHLKASSFGIEFAKTLPLINENIYNDEANNGNTIVEAKKNSSQEDLFEKLSAAAIDPSAEGKTAGIAFEEEIAKVFRYMGFEAKRIGGPGNTDVVVRWSDDADKTIIGIVDAKSKSNGQVSHNDVSDVAIDTHKEKNNADYAAIVGAGFSGDTIKKFAIKKKVALITVQELVDIAKKTKELGLNLGEMALLFQVPDGLSRLEELISIKQREENLINLVVATFRKEQEMLESISARDMFLLLRSTENSPSLEEILNVFVLLSTREINVLEIDRKSPTEENTTYKMKNAKSVVNKLRMIADAIERGIEK